MDSPDCQCVIISRWTKKFLRILVMIRFRIDKLVVDGCDKFVLLVIYEKIDC